MNWSFYHHPKISLDKLLACRITLDGEQWDCSAYRTKKANLAGAWLKLKIDMGMYAPVTRKEFLRRGGKVSWFTSY